MRCSLLFFGDTEVSLMEEKTGGFFMTALQLNADIYRSMSVIALDEAKLKQVAKYLRRLVKQMEETKINK